MAAPWLWILSGPNGAGKSTLARSGALRLLDNRIPRVAQSPDDIALLLPQAAPGASDIAYVRAAQAASDTLIDHAVSERRTVMVETVGSSGKFLPRLTRAKAEGFGIGLVYVTVASDALNAARVEHRVALGGHAVPPEAIRSRRIRSFANFGRFAPLADHGLLIDNTETDLATSQPRPRLLAERRPNEAWVVLDHGRAPELTNVLQGMAEPLIHTMVRAADWRLTEAAGGYAGSADDRRDGFLHFSTAAQLRASAARHRAGEADLLLVTVDVASLGAALRWESAGTRPGVFPHLYGPLPLSAVRGVTPLPLGPAGRHAFPPEIP